jgi:hypothetical protein
MYVPTHVNVTTVLIDYGGVFLRFSFSPGGNGAGLHRLGNYHRHEGQARKHRQV